MQLDIKDLNKSFWSHGQRVDAVRHFSLRVASGSLTIILGPSGCGKSTLLRLIAGLDTPDSGTISLDDRPIDRIPPEKRGIGLVFQEDSLFPNMTLEDQIRWALSNKTKPRFSVEQLLDMGGMTALRRRYPHQLSGGERQRGAILRSLAAEPKVLLLDEPFSRLDAPLRDALRREVRSLFRTTQTTAILVTHDQEEGMALADQLVVMESGRSLQAGTPQSLYAFPTNALVAGFLGRANIIIAQAEGLFAQTVFGPLPIHRPAQGPVRLMIRPEHFELLKGEQFLITDKEFRGHDVSWRLISGELEVLVHTDWEQDFRPGQRVDIRLRRPAVVLEESSG